MRKLPIALFSLLVVLAMLLAPLGKVPPAAARALPPERLPNLLPADLRAAFKDGLTIDQFLARNHGPIPAALWPLVDTPIAVIIQLDQPALITSMLAQGQASRSMSSAAQRSYVAQLSQAQSPLVAEVQARGGTVLGQYTRSYNGVLALVPGKEIAALRKFDGVKAVYRAPQHKVDLTNSVPLIQAPDVWTALPAGYDGSGAKVAIIDTGIDYTHADLGGPGLPSSYSSNNPDVVEAGTFPTAKVVGGWDFAGTAYDADTNPVPVPDADPLDEAGHGTHVASIAAGLGVGGPNPIGSGVAPGADLYALKVFGAAGTTNLVINALEWAVDPNGDGDLTDRMDVINMSLGSIWGTGDDTDPEQMAINNISALGTFVAVSAGNEGDSSYITGAPSVADAALSVAASTTGFITFPVVQYGAGQLAPYEPGNPYTTALTKVLVDVDSVDGSTVIHDPQDPSIILDHATGQLCESSQVTTAGALTNKIALIQRGDCDFELKINNAAALGAAGVIVYNNDRPDDDFISMLTGTATLPAGHTVRSFGLALKAVSGTTVTVGPDSSVSTIAYGAADQVASFSSRGPRGYDSKLKPEITAPGVAIFAAAMGSGSAGISLSGTSMAAPHVAGVAALIHEAHPDWPAEKIKAAMMNTADDLDAADADGYRVVPRTGAGRVNAYNAVFTESVATGDSNLVSLSWGLVQVGADTTSYPVPEGKLIRLENMGMADKTYDVAVIFSDPANMTGASFNLPANVTVPAGQTMGVPVALTLDPTQLPLDSDITNAPLNFGTMEEYYGFITFAEQGTSNVVRVPFYFVPRPYSTLVMDPAPDTEMSITHTPLIDNGLAMINYTQSGPKASNLWAWPALVVDPNETDILDAGDLRAAGIDYAFNDTVNGNGPVLGVAIANWGPIHTLQPYFDETDLWIDQNQDGIWDYTLFNWNYGWLSGGDEDNDWVVLLIDYTGSTVNLFLGSPYGINADFNSGIQEWYVPTTPLNITGAHSRFDYQFFSYDFNLNGDETPQGSFDYVKFPLVWDLTSLVPGGATTLSVGVNSPAGYLISKPKGILLFDYYGKPGVGQASYLPLTVTDMPTFYMPLIHR